MRIPMLLDLGYKNFKCEKVWLEEKPLDARRAAMARRLGEPETEPVLRWEVDTKARIALDDKFVMDLFDTSDRLLFEDGSLDDVKNLFLKYGPLFSSNEVTLGSLKEMLFEFYLIMLLNVLSIYINGASPNRKLIEDILIKPLKANEMLDRMFNKPAKIYKPIVIDGEVKFYPAPRKSWPFFTIPAAGMNSLKTREDIIKYVHEQIIKNAALLLQRHLTLKPGYNKHNKMFIICSTPSDAFTFAVAKVVFGKSEPKKCKCGCGLPALKGDYYNENHKRKMLDTAVKQKVIRYFYKTLDAKHNRERHEAVKEIINKQWNKGVRSENELKEAVRKALHLT